MSSVWTNSVSLPHFPKLDRNISTEVLIIGGGICGILCADLLTQKGFSCVLLEADTIGHGITKNSSAKLTAQHGLIYHKLIRSVGLEGAKQYLLANERALLQYEKLAQNCDYEEKTAYTYSLTDPESVKQEVIALQLLGKSAAFTTKTSLPFDVSGAIALEHQAQFHPLKFIAARAASLRIYEHTRVLQLQHTNAITNSGNVSAKTIIVATHFPFLNAHGSYFLKLYQHRSYMLALENAQPVDAMYVDNAETGMSFRMYHNLLLIGGGDHRTGKNGGNFTELRNFAHKYYPKSNEVAAWSTQDCMSLDGIPYIGAYSAHTPHLFVATGFNKWGMSSSMAAAMILSDMISKQKNKTQNVFSPQRTILKPQLFRNAWQSTTQLLRISKKRCPHMGCALNWNAAEHSWDCPCHGSRFQEDGTLIDNPATTNL